MPRFALHLTIRQKVLVGAIAPILLFSVVGVISYTSLLRMENSLALVEAVDDLSNSILEIRRYEKNYLLYNNPADHKETMAYLGQSHAALQRMTEFRGLGDASRIAPLDALLVAYQTALAQLQACREQAAAGGPNEAVKKGADHLRQVGKELVDASVALKTAERARLLALVNGLQRQLVATGCLLLATGLFFAALLSRKIIRALNTIVSATSAIGKGKFVPLDAPATRDETQRVIEAFNRMIRELERRQKQLIEERKLSSLGVLTSGIAHQLNNPLNNISTSCQILIEEGQTCDLDFAERMLRNIDSEVNRARDIVKGLLEFARAQDFNPKPAKLDEVVGRAFQLVSSHIPSGIELAREVPADLALELDAARMQEVFINLLLNAAQAIETPPGRISVKAHVDEQEREAVILVEDTGPGIGEENLGKVFDPFFTTKEVGKGTGLGLSIVFGIVEKHQGSVTAERAEQGARIVIRLPLERAPEPTVCEARP
jgi:signal transduction histidine kinase